MKKKSDIIIDNQPYKKCNNCHGNGSYMQDNDYTNSYEETDCVICNGKGYN